MDKPQNLLEPPISNYQNNVVKVKDSNNDLNNNLESRGDFPQCTNLISSIGCDIKGNDKPATDDKPAATDDKPAVTDDKPAATRQTCPPMTNLQPPLSPMTNLQPTVTLKILHLETFKTKKVPMIS